VITSAEIHPYVQADKEAGQLKPSQKIGRRIAGSLTAWPEYFNTQIRRAPAQALLKSL
jgi:hypothetical protein